MKRFLHVLIVNTITGIRVPAAIASAYFLLDQRFFPAWVLYLICVSTDVIDGYLARSWGAVTKVGIAFDLYADVAIYWVYVPSAYLYAQRYSPWWQEHLPPITLAITLFVGAALFFLWWSFTAIGHRFVRWYVAKGNFWFGVIPVAAIGCWIALEHSVVAFVLLASYGILALYVCRDTIASKL